MLVIKTILISLFIYCWIAITVVSQVGPTFTKQNALPTETVPTSEPATATELVSTSLHYSQPGPTPIVDFALPTGTGPSSEPPTETKLTSEPPTATEQVPTVLQYSVAYVSGSAAKREWMPVRAQDIDASAYTHLIYSYATIDKNLHLVISDNEESTFLRDLITHVKSTYPGVKVLIAVGDSIIESKKRTKKWQMEQKEKTTKVNHGTVIRHLARNLCTEILECFGLDAFNPHIAQMMKNAAMRNTFILSARSLVAEFGADGLDLDWEYLNAIDLDGQSENSDNFIDLVRELRASLLPELSLSVALPHGLSNSFSGIKVAEMAQHLDFITSMTFDMHGFWECSTVNGVCSGELAAHTDMRDVIGGIDATIGAGVPVEKLMLGIAFYGQAYKQADPNQHEIGSPFVDPKTAMPDAGKCTGLSGVVGFNEISDMIKNKQESVRVNTFDELTKTNIMAFDTDQWVSYDNGPTIEQRISHAHKYGLGGTSVRYLDLDDQDYQLSKDIKEIRQTILNDQ